VGRITGRAVAVTVSAMTASALAWAAPWAAPSASAQTPQPAFYTYQAPGGAATAGKRVIALTFDDGPGPYTPQVLSVLERYGVPATFFEVGEDVAAYPQYTQMVAATGDPVEDHTWSHPNLTTIPVSAFPYQIDQTQDLIGSLTGRTPACVRPPYDAWNTTVLDQIAQRGLTTMSYSVDPRDWAQPGTQAIVNAVVGAAFPGAVVDMHDGGSPRDETVAALPQIITTLRAEGYTFVPICGSPGPAPQPPSIPSAIYDARDHRIHVYARALTSGDLVEFVDDNVGGRLWNAYDLSFGASGGGPISGSPSAFADPADGLIHVYVRSAGGQLVEYDNGNVGGVPWNAWGLSTGASGGGPVGGSPDAFLDAGDGLIHVYVAAASHDLTEYDNGGVGGVLWNAWDLTLGSGGPTVGSNTP